MKKILAFIVGIILVLPVLAQTVTVKVKGNRNKQVVIDGQAYTVYQDGTSAGQANLPITITSLEPGQHSLSVMRTNSYGSVVNTGGQSNFYLRAGYDMTITVNNNGSIQLSETRSQQSTAHPSAYRTPMSDESFRLLLANTQGLSTQNSRLVAVTNAFNNTANYFTTQQARQLIALINAQSNRLTLTRAAYKRITDPVNYLSGIQDLLNTQANRNNLSTYVRNHDRQFPIVTGSGTGIAMSDASFQLLYREAQEQWPTSTKMSYLNNVFSSSSNRFTVVQAKQLIGIVYSENDRLLLAKSAYDNVVDPANYTQLYDLFSFQASRQELANYIGTAGTTAPNFNAIYQETQRLYSNSSRLNYLTGVFANNTNYFTAIQTRQLIELVNVESDRLSLAKMAWDNMSDPVNYAQLLDLFTNSYYRNEFTAYAANNGGSTVVKTAMNETDFNNLHRRISNRYGLGVKMRSLTEEFNKTENVFTTAQARQLIQLVSDESNRLELGKLAFDNVVDPWNYSQLYDVLASQSSKDELDAWVRARSVNTGYPGVRVAMTGESFNALYNQVSGQWGLNARMSSLTDVFANSANYFSTAQAKQLIQLVSAESNRLQLAKSSYDNIVDPENFDQIYDIFSSQASRNELAAYVNAYSYNR